MRKYKAAYTTALQAFYATRTDFINKLKEISFLRVIPSQANYVLCEVKTPYTSRRLTSMLLEDNILIKDLSEKTGFEGRQYVRIAVRKEEDNQALITALKAMELQ